MTLYGFDWILPGELAAMARPGGTSADAAALKGMGVGAVVTLTAWEWRAAAEGEGLDYLHLPMPDFSPPGPEQVDDFIRFCEGAAARGRAVAVHCLAGRGRTGTMVACYLVSKGAAPEEAMALVRSLRPGSIETATQERAVHEYGARVRRGSD